MTHTPIDIAALEALIAYADPTAPLDHAAVYSALRNAAPELIKAVKERDEQREIDELAKHLQQGFYEQTIRINAENARFRALLVEAGEALRSCLDVCMGLDGPGYGDFEDERSALAAIQSTLRDASPTMGKPE